MSLRLSHCRWLQRTSTMKLFLCCLLTSLLSLSASIPHSVSYGRFLPASSRSLFSFSSARDRINSSSRNNYVSYWHFKGQPVITQPSPPAAPTFTTNTRNNNIDPGLVSRRSRPR